MKYLKIARDFVGKHLLKFIGGLLLIIFTILFLCMPESISQKEIRFYIWLFLLFTAIGAFANLRLYNAIVVNSQFIKTLREKFISLGKKLDSLENEVSQNKNKMGSLNTTITNLLNLLKPKK